jgi:peptidoglycan/xylan/chitin deacetylase (PgdA/CDA1 family)
MSNSTLAGPPAILAVGVFALSAFHGAGSSDAQGQTPEQIQAILSAHHRLLVLADAEQRASPADRVRIADVARTVYARREDLLQELHDGIAALVASAPDTGRARVNEVVDAIRSPALHQADQLAFADLLAALQELVRERQLGDVAERLGEALAQLESLRDAYDREMSGERPRGQPPQWEEYLERLRRLIDAAAVLGEERPHETEVLRGPHPGEISGAGLPDTTVLLTFDDGPHPRYTDDILKTLAAAEVRAVFFQVGQRLGTVGEGSDAVSLSAMAAVSRRITAAGHRLANHSYSHRAMGAMAGVQQGREVASTNALLAAITGQTPLLFRPPYGARNTALLDRVVAMQMRSLMWNIDSMDWAEPIPASIVRRVVAQTRAQGRGVLLLHDIHRQTVDALPRVIDELREAGFRIGAPEALDGTPLVSRIRDTQHNAERRAPVAGHSRRHRAQ